MLSRFSAPEKPDRLLWLALLAVIGGYGLWRAARAARAGDELAGLTLTGLVGSLASPISWTHHVYWFLPAVLVLADAGLRIPDPPRIPSPRSAEIGDRRRLTMLVLAVAVYACVAYGVVSFHDWGVAPDRTDSPVEFVLRNMYVLLAVLLLVVLPIRRRITGVPATR
jgi:alpha-1,2-mannosyltransferase